MEDLVETLEKETQIPTADTAFTQPQKLPFTVILDKPVEFYAERIDKANEKKLEDFFERRNWKWTRERTWLPDEKCFETIYQISFIERV